MPSVGTEQNVLTAAAPLAEDRSAHKHQLHFSGDQLRKTTQEQRHNNGHNWKQLTKPCIKQEK